MPSFVEEAVLRVKDEASTNLNKINKELVELLKTMRSLRSAKIEIKNMAATLRGVRELNTEIKKIPQTKTTRFNLTGARQVTELLNALNRLPAQRNFTFNIADGEVRALLALMNTLDSRRYSIHLNSTDILTAIGRTERLSRALSSLPNVNLGVSVPPVQPPVNPPPVNQPPVNPPRVGTGNAAPPAAGAPPTPPGGTPPIVPPIAVGAPSPQNPRTPPVQQPPKSFAQQMVSVNVKPLQIVLSMFIAQLGYTITNAIVEGFRRGMSSADLADTQLDFQPISEGDKAAVRASAADISQSAEFAAFTRGEISRVESELLPIVRGDNTKLEPLTEAVLRMANVQIAMGATAQEAVRNAFKIAKAGERGSFITDPATGIIDLEKAQAFFDTITKGMIQGGVEMTPDLISQTFASLRLARFGLDERGILTAMALAEEQGSSAGVGINQAVAQMSLQRIMVRQRKNMERMGLVETVTLQPGETGNFGDEPITVQRIVNEDYLREHQLGWVIENLLPVMAEGNFDPNSPTDVGRFVGLIASDKTAKEELANLILRANELTQDIDRAMGIDVSEEKISSVLSDSSLLALAKAAGTASSFLGDVGTSLEVITIPALEAFSEGMQYLSDLILDENGNPDPTGTAIVSGVGLAGLLGSIFAVRSVWSFLNPGVLATNLNTGATVANTTALGILTGALAVGGIPGAAGAVAGAAGAGGFMSRLAPLLKLGGITAALAASYDFLTSTEENPGLVYPIAEKLLNLTNETVGAVANAISPPDPNAPIVPEDYSFWGEVLKDLQAKDYTALNEIITGLKYGSAEDDANIVSAINKFVAGLLHAEGEITKDTALRGPAGSNVQVDPVEAIVEQIFTKPESDPVKDFIVNNFATVPGPAGMPIENTADKINAAIISAVEYLSTKPESDPVANWLAENFGNYTDPTGRPVDNAAQQINESVITSLSELVTGLRYGNADEYYDLPALSGPAGMPLEFASFSDAMNSLISNIEAWNKRVFGFVDPAPVQQQLPLGITGPGPMGDLSGMQQQMIADQNVARELKLLADEAARSNAALSGFAAMLEGWRDSTFGYVDNGPVPQAVPDPLVSPGPFGDLTAVMDAINQRAIRIESAVNDPVQIMQNFNDTMNFFEESHPLGGPAGGPAEVTGTIKVPGIPSLTVPEIPVMNVGEIIIPDIPPVTTDMPVMPLPADATLPVLMNIDSLIAKQTSLEPLAVANDLLFIPQTAEGILQETRDLLAQLEIDPSLFAKLMKEQAPKASEAMQPLQPIEVKMTPDADAQFWQKVDSKGVEVPPPFAVDPNLEYLTKVSSKTLADTFDNGAATLETTFETSAVNLTGSISEASSQFGPLAADGFLAMAPAIGEAIGTAAAAQMQNLNINARVQATSPAAAPRLDTASSGPF